MESAERRVGLETLLAAAQRRHGATEPHLTKGMALALGGDRRAAAEVAEALRAASPRGDRLPAPPKEVDCLNEAVWKTARRPLGQRGLPLTRRLDLVFSTNGWCLAVEVKLAANLSRGQLEDALRSDRAALHLESHDHFGVLVLSRDALSLGSPRDPENRLLGNVRWLEVIEDLCSIAFDDPALGQGWGELLGTYTRRGRFGSRAVARPPLGAALQAVHRSLTEHLERHLGAPVGPDVRRSQRVVQATARGAVIIYRTGKRKPRAREITVELTRSPGGRRQATIIVRGRASTLSTASGRVPAAVDKLDQALRDLIDQALDSSD